MLDSYGFQRSSRDLSGYPRVTERGSAYTSGTSLWEKKSCCSCYMFLLSPNLSNNEHQKHSGEWDAQDSPSGKFPFSFGILKSNSPWRWARGTVSHPPGSARLLSLAAWPGPGAEYRVRVMALCSFVGMALTAPLRSLHSLRLYNPFPGSRFPGRWRPAQVEVVSSHLFRC